MDLIPEGLNYLAFICDAVLKYMLDDDIFIETKVKQIWMEKKNTQNSVNLMDFADDPFICEKEYTNMDRLKTIFKLIDNPNNPDSKNKSAEKLHFSPDLSQEDKNPQEIIDRIFRNVPLAVQKLLDILKESLIENYLFNLSYISETQDKLNIDQTNLRKTSPILMVISMLVGKYRFLIADLAFRKTSYCHIISKYSFKIPFLQNLELKTFESITFMECLFETQYLVLSENDNLTVIQLFMLNTGITFLSPDNPSSVIDISKIITIKLVFCFIHQIKKEVFFSQVVLDFKYSTLHIMVILADYIWELLDKNSLKEEIGEYTHSLFLNLIKEILKLLKLIPQNILPRFKFSELNVLIVKILNQLHTIHTSVANEVVEQLKKEDYESFLFDCDLKIQDKYENYIQQIQIMNNSEIRMIQEDNTNSKLPNKSKNKETDIEKKIRGPIFPLYFLLNLPLNHQSLLFNNFSSDVPKTFGMVSPTLFQKKTDNQNLLDKFAKYFYKMGPDLPLNFYNMWLVEFKAVISRNDRNRALPIQKRFYDFVHEKPIINDNQPSQEGNEQLENIKQKGAELVINTTEESKTGLSQNQKKMQSHTKEFLANLHRQNREEFNSFKLQIFSKLKHISEQALVQLLSCPKEKKQAVTQEISRQLESMSELEQNFILCYFDKIEVLKLYECPDHIQKLRKELSPFEQNFFSNLKNEGINSFSNLGNLMTDEIIFCNDDSVNMVQKLQPKKEVINNEVRSKLGQYKFKLNQLNIIDDETVESLISFFYMDPLHNAVTQMFHELCKLATFEVKILDFCFFFLYCPDYLETLSQTKYNFHYSTLVKAKLKPDEVVAKNILNFLATLLKDREGILYQPIFLLDKFGLKSLRDLKEQTKYNEKTFHSASICDLIIGLLEIDKIKKNNYFDPLLSKILSTPKDFDIVEPHEVEDYKKEKNILTLYSCQKILKTNRFDGFFINYPNIVLSCRLDTIIPKIQNYIQELRPALENVNSCLKYKAYNQPESLKLKDIIELSEKQKKFDYLANSISEISSLMLEYILKKDAKKDRIFTKALNTLKEQLLHEKNENFLIHLFELANYLSFEEFSQSDRPNKLMDPIFMICASFYVIVNIQKDSSQLPLIQKTLVPHINSIIPTLSRVVSSQCPSDEPIGNIPLLTSSYSSIRKSKEPDFDSLFIDMSRSHSNLLVIFFWSYIRKKSAMKEIGFIFAKFPWLIDFPTKRQALRDLIQANLQAPRIFVYIPGRDIKIDRNNIIGSTLKEFSNLSLHQIRSKVHVNFKGENGIDRGGLKQEWMTLVIKELFDPIKGLFEISKNGNIIQLTLKSKVAPCHLKYIEFAGIMVGKAIQEGVVVDVNFTKSILKHILGRQITINDLEDIDPDLAKNLRWILENKIDSLDLGLTFTYEFDAFGHRITRELIPNGSEIDVTDDNKREYVKSFCEMKVTGEIKEELEAFIKGIYLILPAGCLSPFTPSELQLLIGGIQTIDIKELAKHTEYEEYDFNSDVIKWFWEILGDFSQKELASLIMFATGSVRVSYEALKQKPFRIARIGYEKDFLPIAHTCYHQIQIPEYISKEELKQKLLIAINEGQGSFAFA